VASIGARDLTPLVVGGTGLYIRALRFGLDPNPPTPPELRDALSPRQLPDLIAELRQIDPATADATDLKNRRRVERALAIALQGTRPNRTSWQTIPRPSTLVVISRDTEDLRDRICSRIDAMFAAGVVDEVRRLVAAGLRPGSQASQALGLRQIEDLLAGRCDEPETKRRLATATRQFAKRQLTWFRRETGAVWLDVPPSEDARCSARRIIELVAAHP